MWKELLSSDVSCTAKHFWDAVQVWINKPHTVNRRLVGSRQTPYGECRRTFNNDRAAELEQSFSSGECEPEKIIRELIPKQLGRFHSSVELIIKRGNDTESCCVFIPLVHTDGQGHIVHEDHTLAYALVYRHDSSKLSVSISTSNEEPVCTSLGVSEQWLEDVLIPKLMSWCAKPSLAVETTSLMLLPVDVYTLKYQYLKNKYGADLVKMWPEKTDPRKFVYEDIGIAAYLMVLWEMERASAAVTRKQSFVDLGCGNGLLVHLLAQEGYRGLGIDIRKRQIWDMYGEETVLEERALTPSDDNLFPEYDWLIGNHSDELTPWIPVIAARSSPSCKFFVLPCCPWDFTCKFAAKRSGLSVYQNYLGFVRDVIDTCGFLPERDTLRIPSTKRVCYIGRQRRGSIGQCDSAIERFIENRRNRQPTTKTDKVDCLADHDIHDGIACVIAGTEQTGAVSAVCETDPTEPETGAVCGSNCLDEALPVCPDPECVSKKAPGTCGHAVRLCKRAHSDADGVETSVSKRRTPVAKECECACTHEKEDLGPPQTGRQQWTAHFKPRNVRDEVVSHCTNVAAGVKERIVHTVFTKLLGNENCPDSTLCLAGGKTWRRGGELAMREVVALFSAETRAQLKSECGGMQTLLKNHHNIFIVQNGQVRLRDWTKFEEFEEFQREKKKRKGLTSEQIAANAAKLWKTQMCFYFVNHPDSCPLSAEQCRYAHGERELRKKL